MVDEHELKQTQKIARALRLPHSTKGLGLNGKPPDKPLSPEQVDKVCAWLTWQLVNRMSMIPSGGVTDGSVRSFGYLAQCTTSLIGVMTKRQVLLGVAQRSDISADTRAFLAQVLGGDK